MPIRERLEPKKASLTDAFTSSIDYHVAPEDVHVGLSLFVSWPRERAWCHIRIEGTTFGEAPLNMQLEVWCWLNPAVVVTDAVRRARVALGKHTGFALPGPSAEIRTPRPRQHHADEARELAEDVIREPAGRCRAEIPAAGDGCHESIP